jgi:hypothetical protein
MLGDLAHDPAAFATAALASGDRLPIEQPLAPQLTFGGRFLKLVSEEASAR